MKLPAGSLTTALALVCTVVFVLLAITGLSSVATVKGGIILARFGGDVIAPPGFMVPAILTPITAFFLHANLVHLALNMVVLLFIGRQLELPLGKAGLAILLLGGIYGGALAEWIASANGGGVIIGASGGISALIATFALVFNRQQVRSIGPIPGVWVRALWLAAAWIGVQLLLGIAGGSFANIAIWSHIGGFVAGLLLSRPILRWRFRGR